MLGRVIVYTDRLCTLFPEWVRKSCRILFGIKSIPAFSIGIFAGGVIPGT